MTLNVFNMTLLYTCLLVEDLPAFLLVLEDCVGIRAGTA